MDLGLLLVAQCGNPAGNLTLNIGDIRLDFF